MADVCRECGLPGLIEVARRVVDDLASDEQSAPQSVLQLRAHLQALQGADPLEVFMGKG